MRAGHQVSTIALERGRGGGESRKLPRRRRHALRRCSTNVVPITWMAVGAEWQRDWAHEKSAAALGEALVMHAGGTSVAMAWESQPLGAQAK